MQLNYGKPPNSHLSTRPGYNGTSIREFTEVFGSEDACLEHIWERRFGSDFICPRCGDKTPWYRRRGKRYFQHGCSHVISPVAGTMMHASKVPLTLWHYALLHHANSAESIDGVFLSRQLGVTQATAYRIQRRIRYQLAALQVMDQPCASQDYVQVRCDYLTRVRTTNTASRNRAWIFLIGSGSAVDVTVVDDPHRHVFKKILEAKAPAARQVITTCYRTGQLLSSYGTRKPLAVFEPTYFHSHAAETDAISGFLNYVSAPLKNRHRHISKDTLWSFLKAFEFRFNRRSEPHRTFWDMTSRYPVLDDAHVEKLQKLCHIQSVAA